MNHSKMTKEEINRHKIVKSHNILNSYCLMDGTLTTVFAHPSGIYYDPVGDEIMTVKRIRKGLHTVNGQLVDAWVYEIDFGDQKMVGIIKDHGLHECLELTNG